MSYLIKNALLANSPYSERVDVRIQGKVIAEIAPEIIPKDDEEPIDASQYVIYPGFVNTHHHLAQSILKGIPEGLNQNLGEWLGSVPYRFWPYITPDIMYHAACLGFYELLRSGVTTCADHHYLYHANISQELEDSVWQAAADMGIRFVLCRGGATVLGSHKGLAKAGVVPESIDMMIDRLGATVRRYHDQDEYAMRKVVVAPTSLIHSSTPDDLKLLAEFARANQLRMHSHLLEVGFDQRQAIAQYGMSAVMYAHSCGWLGEDVWFAHLVQANHQDIELLASTRTGIAHCPTSNCRLGSGIAPVIAMEKAGMPISIGVDGSASSESGSMLQEMNLAWLIHRSQNGPAATTLHGVLSWGTAGGAQCLGLKKVGQLAVGYAADFVMYDLTSARMAGCHEQVFAPLLCGEPAHVSMTFVNGQKVFSQHDTQEMECRLAANAIGAIEKLQSIIAGSV
jgi:cytosine/adenosine deaminase-related metal-dependent hydrolase